MPGFGPSGYPVGGFPANPAALGGYPGVIPSAGYPIGTFPPPGYPAGGFPPGYNPWLGAYARPQYASTGRRLVSYIIDIIVFQFIWQPIQIILSAIVGTSVSPTNFGGAMAASIATFVLYVVVYGLYVAGQEGAWGQTLGKRALGIKVVKEDGSPIDYDSALIRYIFLFLAPLGFFGIVTLCTIAFSEKKQRIGDRAAGTFVVKTS